MAQPVGKGECPVCGTYGALFAVPNHQPVCEKCRAKLEAEQRLRLPSNVIPFDGGRVAKVAVGSQVVYVDFENRGTSYECVVSMGLPYGDVLTVVNFKKSMRLPSHWRAGDCDFYVGEKLGMNSADTEGVMKMLRYVAQNYPASGGNDIGPHPFVTHEAYGDRLCGICEQPKEKHTE